MGNQKRKKIENVFSDSLRTDGRKNRTSDAQDSQG